MKWLVASLRVVGLGSGVTLRLPATRYPAAIADSLRHIAEGDLR